MTLECGSTFFSGTGDNTQQVKQGLLPVAISVALAIAFSRAWERINEEFRQECKATCNRKTGVVGFRVSYTVAKNSKSVTCSVHYILLVRCSDLGANRTEPALGSYDELAELAPPPVSSRRGRKRKKTSNFA